MTPPKLIIFDCDGVLVDSEPLSVEFLVNDLARYGLSLTIAECEMQFVGGTTQGDAVTATRLGATLPTDWAETFDSRVEAYLKTGVPLVSGVSEVLDAVEAAGIAHCIVSNGSEQKMQITLGQNGLWDRFHGRIFSAITHGTAKPDPELLLIAARHFGTAPTDCVVIDDSVSGCSGAANAGMPCIGYAERSDPEKLAATGATVIRSMAELPPLIRLG